MAILSDKEGAKVMHRLLESRKPGGATKDELNYYVELEEKILYARAQQELLEKSKISVEWNEAEQDYRVWLTE